MPAQTLLDIIEDREAGLQVHASALAHLRSSAAGHLDHRDQLTGTGDGPGDTARSNGSAQTGR